MGVLINRTALADTLFRAARAAFARTGRAETLAGLFLGVLLSPMSGSVGASVAMLSRTLYPRLKSAGLPESRSLALVCVSSTLGVVVPPSLVLILLGDAMLRAHTEAQHLVATDARIVNTQDVFHAALVPAGLFLLLCIAIAAWQGRSKTDARTDRCPRADAITALAAAAFIVALLAGVALGYLYAVEAAATGGVALMVHALATRALDRNVLRCDAPRDDGHHRRALRAAGRGNSIYAGAASLRDGSLARGRLRVMGGRRSRCLRWDSAWSPHAPSCSMPSR